MKDSRIYSSLSKIKFAGKYNFMYGLCEYDIFCTGMWYSVVTNTSPAMRWFSELLYCNHNLFKSSNCFTVIPFRTGDTYLYRWKHQQPKQRVPCRSRWCILLRQYRNWIPEFLFKLAFPNRRAWNIYRKYNSDPLQWPSRLSWYPPCCNGLTSGWWYFLYCRWWSWNIYRRAFHQTERLANEICLNDTSSYISSSWSFNDILKYLLLNAIGARSNTHVIRYLTLNSSAWD